MTEFKRLAALHDELRDVVADGAPLHPASVDRVLRSGTDDDIASLRATFDHILHDVIGALEPRLERMVLKAREKNPDLQTSNENMCLKIEALNDSATSLIAQVVPMEGDILEAYSAVVQRRSATAAWQTQLLESVAAVAAREADERVMAAAEERRAYAGFLTAELMGRKDIAAAANAVIEAQRLKESQRRVAESSLFRSRKIAFTASKADSLSAVMADIDALLQLPSGRHTAAALAELVHRIAVDPEDPSARRIRTNNADAIAQFGHPFITFDGRGDGVVSSSEENSNIVSTGNGGGVPWVRYTQSERERHRLAESVLAAVGFEARYSDDNGVVTNYNTLPVRLPSAAVAAYSGEWRVRLQPEGTWDRYGERFLDLSEIPADVDPDAWCAWFDAIGALDAELARRRLR